MEITEKEWEKFLEFIHRTHNLNRDWIPHRPSIELWEEYKNSKRRIK